MRYRWAVVVMLSGVLGCKMAGPMKHNLPPAEMLMHPGPGVDGPGPGVLAPDAGGGGFPLSATSQVAIQRPEGMTVTWDVSSPGMFDSEPIVAPGRYNFPQGAIYRFKLTTIPGRAGVELYPTIEIAPTMPRTDAYLAHNAIPFELTEEDLDQVLSGNFVTKVLFLPDAEFQELAVAGVETLVSTRLDPGVDPIIEADRRGSILAIIRLGNKDLQIPGVEDDATAGYYGGSISGMGGPDGACGPGGCCGPDGFGSIGGQSMNNASAVISGVNSPQWGMPISGTPIGLPGPPHIPLGVPAGLQKHVIANHTHMHLPRPSRKIRIDVNQKPGMSYPKPATNVHITEHAFPNAMGFHQPLDDKFEMVH